MSVLLAFSRGTDWMNAQFGVIANWLVLLACLISAGNAFSRYLISVSSNGWLEIHVGFRLSLWAACKSPIHPVQKGRYAPVEATLCPGKRSKQFRSPKWPTQDVA